jgi:H+/Cl- antiporter ClcA
MLSFNELANKLRQWDNRSNQWFSKNFSILLFEIVLAIVFFFFINTMMDVFTISAQVSRSNILEQIMLSQTGFLMLIVLLLIFNSFLMLYLFSNMLRMRGILKNMDYSLSRRRDNRDRDEE